MREAREENESEGSREEHERKGITRTLHKWSARETCERGEREGARARGEHEEIEQESEGSARGVREGHVREGSTRGARERGEYEESTSARESQEGEHKNKVSVRKA